MDDEGLVVLVFTEDGFVMVFLEVLDLVFVGEEENSFGRFSIFLMIVSNTLLNFLEMVVDFSFLGVVVEGILFFSYWKEKKKREK